MILDIINIFVWGINIGWFVGLSLCFEISFIEIN